MLCGHVQTYITQTDIHLLFHTLLSHQRKRRKSCFRQSRLEMPFFRNQIITMIARPAQIVARTLSAIHCQKIKNSRRSAFCTARRRRRIQTQCRPWARSRQHPPKSFKSFFLRGGIQVSTFLISIISSNNDSIICAIAKTPILGRRKDVYLKSQ